VSQTKIESPVRVLPIVGVAVIPERDGKIALGLRRYKNENVWSLPGGKVEPFESIVHCGQRELTEETDLVAKDLKIFAIYEFMEQVENYHSITFGAVSHSITGELHNLEPQTFAAWEWFDLADLPAPLFPPSYHLLAAYRISIDKSLNIPQIDSVMIAHRHL
jgi:ADP-ribose pyrophosphatase YjhB (NUDIX family)